MTIVRNILAVIAGIIIGSLINMTIVMLGPLAIPSPAGADMNSVEGMARSMHLFEPRHFIAPFLAHAVGTLSGALVAFLIAASYKTVLAYVVGGFFLIGGIAACFMIPAPTWFMALDLIAAYIPMAWLATLIGRGIGPGNTATA